MLGNIQKYFTNVLKISRYFYCTYWISFQWQMQRIFVMTDQTSCSLKGRHLHIPKFWFLKLTTTTTQYHYFHQHLHYLPHHNHHDLQHDLHHQEELPTWIPLCLRWRSSPCSATPAGWPVAGRGGRGEWRGCRPAPPCQPPWRRRGLKVANY